jgi:CheY-like chemotaxis protein
MVVDDSDANRLLLQRLLDEVGFDVRTAANGEEALALFTQWRPHFIWMDMRMPVMDGYEASREIKAAPGGEETVIVALTASTSQDEHRQVRASGCAEVVRKPFEDAVIFDTMRRYLHISYRYADKGETPTVTGNGSDVLERLAELPEAQRHALREAVVIGDVYAVEQQARTIAASDEALGRALMEQLAAFHYNEILAALGQEEQ